MHVEPSVRPIRTKKLSARKVMHITSPFPFSLRLLIHISRTDALAPVRGRGSIGLLVRKVPAVQVARGGAQVGREAQPGQIRAQTPGRDGVDAGPDVGQVGGDAGEGDDVGGGLDGALEAEEEGHPDEVEAELDGEERRSLLRRVDQSVIHSFISFISLALELGLRD